MTLKKILKGESEINLFLIFQAKWQGRIANNCWTIILSHSYKYLKKENFFYLFYSHFYCLIQKMPTQI